MMRRDRPPRRVWSAAIAHTITRPVIAVVMGVSGSGKTTVAALLAAALGCQFQEGDDLHPAANVEKMHGGTPLTDADRLPWLRKIAEEKLAIENRRLGRNGKSRQGNGENKFGTAHTAQSTGEKDSWSG